MLAHDRSVTSILPTALRLTVRPGWVFTREIEHVFEKGLFRMMLEVLL